MLKTPLCAYIAIAGFASFSSLSAWADTPFTLQPHPIGQPLKDQVQVDLNNDGIPDLLTSSRSTLTSLLSGSAGSFVAWRAPSSDLARASASRKVSSSETCPFLMPRSRSRPVPGGCDPE